MEQQTLDQKIKTANLVINIVKYPMIVFVGLYCFLHYIVSDYQMLALTFMAIFAITFAGAVFVREQLKKKKQAGSTFYTGGKRNGGS